MLQSELTHTPNTSEKKRDTEEAEKDLKKLRLRAKLARKKRDIANSEQKREAMKSEQKREAVKSEQKRDAVKSEQKKDTTKNEEEKKKSHPRPPAEVLEKMREVMAVRRKLEEANRKRRDTEEDRGKKRRSANKKHRWLRGRQAGNEEE